MLYWDLLTFSSKLKASICCSLPHLKLVPPLVHCHLTHQQVLKAGDRPALGWYVVHLSYKGEGCPVGADSSPKSFKHDAFLLVPVLLPSLTPLDYQVSGPGSSSSSLIMTLFQDKGCPGLFSNVFSLPWFEKQLNHPGWQFKCRVPAVPFWKVLVRAIETFLRMGERREVFNNPEGAVFNMANFNLSIQ